MKKGHSIAMTNYPRGLRAKANLYKDACDINIIKEDIRRIIMNHKEFYSEVSYTMSEGVAKDLLAQRKGDEKKMRPQEYLCQVVNEQFGVKGHCVKVIIG